MSELIKSIVSRLHRLVQRGARSGSEPEPLEEKTPYARWIRGCDTLTDDDREAMARHIAQFEARPLISIVMPVYETPEVYLRQAIESVQRQTYPNWELCIADDASPAPHVGDVLRELSKTDARIKWMRRSENGHIAAATNSALELASGAFVALMDHDDVLAEHALYHVALEANRRPDVDLIYSDEDHIDVSGARSTPYFKSDWNRELMLGHNLINHLCVCRRSLVAQVGGLRLGFEGAQDYDLFLRIVDATLPERIRHIPAVLYHWRQTGGTFSQSAAERCAAAARRAVEDHLQRRGESAEIDPHPLMEGWQRVRCVPPAASPLVSLLVPTKDKADLLGRCVKGLLTRTSYKNIEILIIDHQSAEAATHALFDEMIKDCRVRILRYEGAFNYSAINNFAAAQARGAIIGLVNNDIDVIEPAWLDDMVAHAVRPEVGAVGARLLYEDGRVQHAGVVVGVGDVAGHYCKYIARDDPGYFGRATLASEVTAVTAACLILRKSVFDEIGGLDADNLAIAYSDVDLCLKIRAKGYLNIFTPSAELYHLESASRGPDTAPDKKKRADGEIFYMQTRWMKELVEDPYYNLNFSLQSENFELACPPRRAPPWLPMDTPPGQT